MKKKWLDPVVTLVGIVLLLFGLIWIKGDFHTPAAMRGLPYVCIGLGCGLFGQGIGSLISSHTLKKHPELQKQMEISRKDERTQAIQHRAKSKAFDRMLYVFSALILAFAVMGVDVVVVLLLVFVYLFVIGTFVYYFARYDKEM